MRSSLQNRFSEVKAIIVDDISMVSNALLYIHLHLVDFFACQKNIEKNFSHCSCECLTIATIKGKTSICRIYIMQCFKIAELREELNYCGALHIFAENVPANIHNITMLESIENELYSIQAIDDRPKNVPLSKIEQVFDQNHREIGGFAGVL